MNPLLFNLAAQGVGAALSLIVLPLCAHTLGAEAFGILGLAASLQMAVFLLDGCNVLTRLVAANRILPDGEKRTAALIGSAERFYWGVLMMGTLASLILAWPLGGWLAQRGQLPESVLMPAMVLIGVSALLKLVASHYRGSVVGLHHHVRANAVSLVANIIRSPLAYLSTLIWPDLRLFLAVQAASFLLEAVWLRLSLHRDLPALKHPDLAQGRTIWRGQLGFLQGSIGLATLGVMAVQSDKFLLASHLSLADLGAVSLAVLLCNGVLVLATPVHQMFLPQLVEANDRSRSQAILNSVLATLWCLAWPVMVVTALLAPSLATLVSPGGNIDRDLLARSFFFWGLGNGFTLVNTGLALTFFAAGRLKRYAACHAITLMLYLPLLWWSLEEHGYAGAGAAFLGSQVFLMVVLALTLLRLALASRTSMTLLALPSLAVAVAAGSGGIIWPHLPGGFSASVVVVSCVFLLSLAACALCLWRWVARGTTRVINPEQP